MNNEKVLKEEALTKIPTTLIANKKVVEAFKLEEILKLQEKRLLIDFTKPARTGQEIKILHSWAGHFKKGNIPYAITKGTLGYILWKENRVQDNK